jgi:hypothetical protein
MLLNLTEISSVISDVLSAQQNPACLVTRQYIDFSVSIHINTRALIYQDLYLRASCNAKFPYGRGRVSSTS